MRTETQEVPSEHQETRFYCKGDQAISQVAVRPSKPIFGFPSPESPMVETLKSHLDRAVANLNLLQVALLEQVRAFDQMISRGPFQPQTF